MCLVYTFSYCTNSSADNSSEAPEPPVPPPVRAPSDTLQIRFKRGSRRRRKLQEEGVRGEGQRTNAKAAAEAAPKKWEEMSMVEKALELYVGEKGLLFWLNKFAYASIFIVIGAWIVFRFVGPALNLYNLILLLWLPPPCSRVLNPYHSPTPIYMRMSQCYFYSLLSSLV
ncbi:endoglucanase 2-like [Hibiscus syriacus]|uniref:Endoglucanase 2-like n=1 Tax=Hibiscus syriacus TaxID=106335 RepID=A0A6A3AYA3_HIBSY|nr:endoglucanase 2-like [Hibiscus syriacus]